MKKKFSNVVSYCVVIIMALLLAANYYIFIIENQFAPAGLNGVATMLQYKTGFSISYMSLLLNIPLCIFVYFMMDRQYAIKSLVFTLVYSFAFLYLQNSGMSHIQYNSNGHDTIYPVIISGVISGFVCGVCFKYGSASGPTEIISKYISFKKPRFNFFFVTFALSAVVAFISLFVYSDTGVINYKPVALCITYCFVTNLVGNYLIKGAKNAYQFTVITTHPDEICQEITHVLRHGVTKISVQGAYTQTEKTMLLCVVNKHQIADFKRLIDKYDDTFSFCELISETYGNFKQIKK